LAEQAERYDEMAEFMKAVAHSGKCLTVEERNLLSVAYKNAVGSRRASWRIVNSVQTKETSKGNDENSQCAAKYQKIVEDELNGLCNSVQEILVVLLNNIAQSEDSESNAESRVFYQKMCGDYYRYQAEYCTGESKSEHAENAKKSYKAAQDAATGVSGVGLAVTHPIRLGLALNFSVFYYEVLNLPEDACAMARTAFEDAIAELDNVSEDSYKDSTLIMQLLRDNLTLWTSDQGDEGAQ